MNLNINSVTNSANVGSTNVNLTQNQYGQTQVIIPEGMSKSDAGQALLARLSEGDRFTGEITNITRDQITISLSDSVSINAVLADALSYNIGDVASFVVKSSAKDMIVLKSDSHEHTKSLMNDQTIQAAIKNAGLPVNESNISLIQNMMKYELPINAESVNAYVKLAETFPNASQEDIIILKKMDIPVTNENIEALHDYYDYNEGMSAKAGELSDILLSNIQNMPESVVPATVSILYKFVNSFSEPFTDIENLNAKIKPEALENMAKLISESSKEADGALDVFAKKITDGSLTAKDFLNEFTTHYKEGTLDASTAKRVIDSPEFKMITDNFIRQQMFINPEDVNKQNIKKLYSKILTDTKNLSENFTGIKTADNLLNLTSSIRNNVEFLNQANQFMNFVQIPLKMSGNNAHGDLYVMKNKTSNSKNTDELSAFLHLDMANLGPMDIMVKLKNKNVTTNFKVRDDVLDYIENNIELLNVRLRQLGYNVSSTVSVSEKNSTYSFKERVIDSEIPPAQIKRFSFDVRA